MTTGDVATLDGSQRVAGSPVAGGQAQYGVKSRRSRRDFMM
jgi:hypothetical protein